MEFLHRVQAVIVLDDTGKRIFAKYYCGEDAPDTSKALAPLETQRQLEQSIFSAIHNVRLVPSYSSEENILIMNGHTVIFHLSEDVSFIVVGDCRENELVLRYVLVNLIQALMEELGTHYLDSRKLLEEYQALLLTVDTILDEGIIFSTDSSSIAAEVSPYLADTGSEMTKKALSTVNKYLRDNL